VPDLTLPRLCERVRVSNNRRGWWDLEPGRRLGYEPRDDSEIYADEVENGPDCEFQGGVQFTGPGTTP